MIILITKIMVFCLLINKDVLFPQAVMVTTVRKIKNGRQSIFFLFTLSFRQISWIASNQHYPSMLQSLCTLHHQFTHQEHQQHPKSSTATCDSVFLTKMKYVSFWWSLYQTDPLDSPGFSIQYGVHLEIKEWRKVNFTFLFHHLTKSGH